MLCYRKTSPSCDSSLCGQRRNQLLAFFLAAFALLSQPILPVTQIHFHFHKIIFKPIVQAYGVEIYSPLPTFRTKATEIFSLDLNRTNG